MFKNFSFRHLLKRPAPNILGIVEAQNKEAKDQPSLAESVIEYLETPPVHIKGLGVLRRQRPKKQTTLNELVQKEMQKPYAPPAPGSLADLVEKEVRKVSGQPQPVSSRLHQKAHIHQTGGQDPAGLKIDMDNRSVSFAEFEQRQGSEGNETLRQLYETAYRLIGNAFFDPLVADKPAALRKIAAELATREAAVTKAKTKDKEKPWELLATPEGEQVWIKH